MGTVRGPIAIDGPAASGKSTVALALARQLAGCYISTGEMYRAVTWLALKAGVAPDDEQALEALLGRTQLDLKLGQEQARLLLAGAPLPADELRGPSVSEAVSHFAQQAFLRSWLVDRQRAASTTGLVIMEGRDIGTVVFPNAPHKFFITATAEARARRRLAQQGEVRSADLAAVAKAIEERDQMDSKRALAPLKQAPDAIRIDTTPLSVEEVVQAMTRQIAPSARACE